MPAQLMIFARAKHDEIFKGVIVEVRDDIAPGSHWLPDMVVVNITDATKAQVENYMEPWTRTFDYEILVENAQGWRIKISVNPNIRTELGIDKAFRDEMKDYLVNTWGAQVHEYDSVNHEYATLDFPKPLIFIPDSTEKTLQELKVDFHDKAEDAVSYRRYIFAESDVDTVISAGGYMDLTKAQVTSKVIDRLA